MKSLNGLQSYLPKRLSSLWFEASNYSILAHCTWRAMPWCVLDNIGHTIHPERDSDGIVEPLPGRWQWICDRHDKAITRGYTE